MKEMIVNSKQNGAFMLEINKSDANLSLMSCMQDHMWSECTVDLIDSVIHFKELILSVIDSNGFRVAGC